VAVEDLAHEVVHLSGRLAAAVVEEARGGVRDRVLVVAHLEDGHAAHADGDLLLIDALDLEDRLVGLQREVLGLLQDGQDERAAAGDDLEHLPRRRGLARPDARDDQRLIGRGDLPQALEQQRQEQGKEDDRPDDDQDHEGCVVHCASLLMGSLSRVTSTVRGGSYSITTISS
jgi:hypothetical protein